ncbi:MAG: phosphate ABC transporter permease PstC, partial [Variovorax sp.]
MSTPFQDAPPTSERPVSSTFPANASVDIAAERARATSSPPPVKRPRTGAATDRLFGWAAKGAALLTLAMLVGILLSLL